jgi:hypothetical protein
MPGTMAKLTLLIRSSLPSIMIAPQGGQAAIIREAELAA